MSLTENKYIRYFGGHDKRVVTMAMNPADETFLSGRLLFHCHEKSFQKIKVRAKLITVFYCSLDKSIRLWDLRSNHCQVKRFFPLGNWSVTGSLNLCLPFLVFSACMNGILQYGLKVKNFSMGKKRTFEQYGPIFEILRVLTRYFHPYAKALLKNIHLEYNTYLQYCGP